jgi:lipopolysaccharide export system protein LptC
MNGGPTAANLVGGAAFRDKNAATAATSDAGPEKSQNQKAGGSYSRFVSLTKVVLPFLALALIGLVMAWPHLKTDTSFSIGFSSAQLAGETQPGMDNARYVGTDQNRQPYSVTADVARIVSEASGEVDLDVPKADLTLDDGTWLVMTADTGRYQGDLATLELNGNVNLFHDTGYEITTQQLMVHLKAGTAEGNTILTGHGPFGELKAQGIKLIEKGQVIYFTGPAQLILYTPQDGGS